MKSEIVVKNLLLSYSESGESVTNNTIIFLHGWRSQKEVWTTVVKNLPARVIAIDLPGFGQSQIPVTPMTVGDYAEVVAEFIKKLGLKKVIIVGHSFGGRVGIKLASQNPSVVSKLILVDSAGFAMDSSKKSLMSVGTKIVKPFFKPKFMQGIRKSIYKKIGAEDYLATPELQKTFINIIGEDLSEDMKKITCATLIINGENDFDTPVEFGKRMNALIPNSKFLILPNAGHFSFLDQPEKFVKEIISFI